MAALGVTDYRYLGEPGELRDSGMAYDENNRAVARETIRPDTFWATDLLVSANRLVAILREVRPQVLVTYDENGAYGHPDHIQAHRVATYAHALAGHPVVPARSRRAVAGAEGLLERHAALDAWSGGSRRRRRWTPTSSGSSRSTTSRSSIADELVTTEIDGRECLDQKMDAMRAHATQIAVDGPFFALSNHIGWEALGVEHYRLVYGELGPVDPDDRARDRPLRRAGGSRPAVGRRDADQSAAG